MNTNAPTNYICPICLGNNGVESSDTLLKQNDLVYEDDIVNVWINSFWIKGNEGHVIVVPKDHFETIYEIPNNIGSHIFKISKQMSAALKEVYKCDGITIRQNNEPAGDQHAFHYHLHIFPRYKNDKFNENAAKKSILSDSKERIKYSDKLRKYISKH